jgi:hypothetical protein
MVAARERVGGVAQLGLVAGEEHGSFHCTVPVDAR